MKQTTTTRLGGNGEAMSSFDKVSERREQTPNAPIVLCEISRNTREDIRFCLSPYSGGMTLDIRAWFKGEHGSIPTRTGIAFGVRHLREIELAIGEAIRIAETQGHLTGKEAGR